ncbi:MAG TPA: hypothetical protein VFI42_03000 [Thermomicrobiaceae bacterium]|nr:hypothetical protein [Thermomicrobiaceae bacterium]
MLRTIALRRVGRLVVVALAIALAFIAGAAYQTFGAPSGTTLYACLSGGGNCAGPGGV